MLLTRTIAAALVWGASGLLPGASQAAQPCQNPNGLGVARTVEIDTTGGPGFGLEQYKMHDFLL